MAKAMIMVNYSLSLREVRSINTNTCHGGKVGIMRKASFWSQGKWKESWRKLSIKSALPPEPPPALPVGRSHRTTLRGRSACTSRPNKVKRKALVLNNLCFSYSEKAQRNHFILSPWKGRGWEGEGSLLRTAPRPHPTATQQRWQAWLGVVWSRQIPGSFPHLLGLLWGQELMVHREQHGTVLWVWTLEHSRLSQNPDSAVRVI